MHKFIRNKIHKLIEWLTRTFDYSKDIKYKNFKTRSGNVTVINSPTGNCQLFCIKQFDRLLNLSERKFNSIIKESLHFTDKQLLLLDINNYNLKETLERLEPKFDVISEEHYESSNYSDMVILILMHNPFKKIKEKTKEKKELKPLKRLPGESRTKFFFRVSNRVI